jgi:SAM-dependent methyltransferase
MAKTGEIAYLGNLARQRGEQAVRHALGKPFTDVNCAAYLAEIAAILSLLPPPGRLLDLGCGTGWTSFFFAKAGWDVVGADISPDMICHARDRCQSELQERLQFLIADYEEYDGAGQFDAVVFFDSLHHAVDEAAALRCAWRALKPGGICVASEPGGRHGSSMDARAAVRQFDVTEKGMPPLKIIRLARRIGFTQFCIYPHAARIQREIFTRPLYADSVANRAQRALQFCAGIAVAPWRMLSRTARLAAWNEIGCWGSGITVLFK